MAKDKLVTPSYCAILTANFLLFFAFYLILPILPFYLTEVFNTDNATVGLVLSSYTLAALCIRPFSGYLLDAFSRKPLYLISYFLFTSIFVGYVLAGLLSLFIMLRVVHGLAFGMVTVAGNTIVIDITPSSRRGEAIGFYGLMNNLAMSFGPMAGLLLHSHFDFNTIFLSSLASGTLGFIMACSVKTPKKETTPKEPLSLDRFFLVKGVPAGISLLLLSVPYGMMTTYVAVYATNIEIGASPGLFFTMLAVGLGSTRIFSGKAVDKGHTTQLIKGALITASISFFSLSLCEPLMGYNQQAATLLFFATAILLGVSFGVLFPAFNSLFVCLAPNNKRGTATSTYLTSWDLGLGIGMLSGGYIAQEASLGVAYFAGACLTVISAILFYTVVSPHYHKNKIK